MLSLGFLLTGHSDAVACCASTEEKLVVASGGEVRAQYAFVTDQQKLQRT